MICRSSGDLLFPDDPRLSNQYCRIVSDSTGGLGVHDMGSANGTYVDGKLWKNQKVYTFKIGNSLNVGQQAFKSYSYAKKVEATPKEEKGKRRRLVHATFYLGADCERVLPGLAVYVFVEGKNQPSQSPWLNRRMKWSTARRAPLSIYTGNSAPTVKAKITEKQMAIQIRAILLPALTACKSN